MEEETIYDGYAALALAIVYNAALDIKSENPALVAEARAWLQLVGLSWCQILDVPEKELADWVANDFDLQSSAHRNWRY
jgi:hypothetical protein